MPQINETASTPTRQDSSLTRRPIICSRALARIFTGTARKSLKTIVLHVYRDFFNTETGTAEAGKPRSWGWTRWRDLRELWGYF